VRNVREFILQVSLFILYGFLTCHKILRHGTDGFTSPPKAVVLRILSPLKIHRPRPSLKSRSFGPMASTLTTNHRGRQPDRKMYSVSKLKRTCFMEVPSDTRKYLLGPIPENVNVLSLYRHQKIGLNILNSNTIH
jgi:hypothetical protein